jgi:hypothetical protein
VSIPWRPGTPTYKLYVKTRSSACIHVLPHKLELQTTPPCRGGLRRRHVSRGPGPRIFAEESSGAATCSSALDLTSLQRWAPVPSRVPLKDRERQSEEGEWETINILRWDLAYIPESTWCTSLLTQSRPLSYRQVIDPRNWPKNRSGNKEWMLARIRARLLIKIGSKLSSCRRSHFNEHLVDVFKKQPFKYN